MSTSSIVHQGKCAKVLWFNRFNRFNRVRLIGLSSRSVLTRCIIILGTGSEKWFTVSPAGKNDCSSLVTDDWNSNDTYPTTNIYSVRSDCSRHVAKHHCKAGRQYVLNVLCESQIKQYMPSKETNKLEDPTFQA